MIARIKETELEYIKCYSKHIEKKDYITFWDAKFQDLYNNNVTILKDKVNMDNLNELIVNQTKMKRKLKKDFFILELDYSLKEEEFNKLNIKPTRIDRFDYLSIDSKKYEHIPYNEKCYIFPAACKNHYKEAIKFSLKDNSMHWGYNFTYNRIKRKVMAYKEKDNLSLYLCSINGEVVGSCELLTNVNTAKVEDFGVGKKFQGKGIGKSILREMLRICYENNIHKAYVVTEQKGKVNEMYKKLGFIKSGEKIQLIYEL